MRCATTVIYILRKGDAVALRVGARAGGARAAGRAGRGARGPRGDVEGGAYFRSWINRFLDAVHIPPFAFTGGEGDRLLR
jgi:hypothetical protein